MRVQLWRLVRGKWPHKKFVWHSLVVADPECKKQGGKKYGYEYIKMSEATGGIVGLCM